MNDSCGSQYALYLPGVSLSVIVFVPTELPEENGGGDGENGNGSDGWVAHEAALLSVSRLSRSLRGARVARFVASALSLVLGEPRFRHAFLRAREPRLGDEVVKLFAVEPGEVRDSDEHR